LSTTFCVTLIRLLSYTEGAQSHQRVCGATNSIATWTAIGDNGSVATQ